MYPLMPVSPRKPTDDVRELGWNSSFKQKGDINQHKHHTFLGGTSRALKTKNGTVLRLKQQVKVQDLGSGTIRYLGDVNFAKGKWVGVAMDKPVGRHNGTVEAVQYFQCNPKCGVFVKSNTVQPRKSSAISPRKKQTVDQLCGESTARIEEYKEARSTVNLMLHGQQHSDVPAAGQTQLRRRLEFFDRQIEREYDNINKTLKGACSNKDSSISQLRISVQDAETERDELKERVAYLEVALEEAQSQAYILQPPDMGLFACGTFIEYKPCKDGQTEASTVAAPPSKSRALTVDTKEERYAFRSTAGLSNISPSRISVQEELDGIEALEAQANAVLQQFGNFIRGHESMAPVSKTAIDPRNKTMPAKPTLRDGTMDSIERRGGYLGSKRGGGRVVASPRSSSFSVSSDSWSKSPRSSPMRRHSGALLTQSAKKNKGRSRASSRSGSRASSRSGSPTGNRSNSRSRSGSTTPKRRSSGSQVSSSSVSSSGRAKSRSRAITSPPERYTSPGPAATFNSYRQSHTSTIPRAHSVSRQGKSRSLSRSRGSSGSDSGRRRHSFTAYEALPSSASRTLPF